MSNVRAPYSNGSNFRQYFYGVRYPGHPLTSTENLTGVLNTREVLYGVLCVIRYFPKLRGHVTLNTFLRGMSFMPALTLVKFSKHTEFEVASFTPSRDTLEPQTFKSGSRDHGYAAFR